MSLRSAALSATSVQDSDEDERTAVETGTTFERTIIGDQVGGFGGRRTRTEQQEGIDRLMKDLKENHLGVCSSSRTKLGQLQWMESQLESQKRSWTMNRLILRQLDHLSALHHLSSRSPLSSTPSFGSTLEGVSMREV